MEEGDIGGYIVLATVAFYLSLTLANFSRLADRYNKCVCACGCVHMCLCSCQLLKLFSQ